MSLRDWPIKKKLTMSLLLVSGLVLLLASVPFVTYQVLTSRQTTLKDLSTLGRVIAANATASLAFANETDAKEILSALKADPHVVAAGLYDKEGRLFATYPAIPTSDTVPDRPGADGYRFTGGHLIGVEPVAQAGNARLGSLYLSSDLRAVNDALQLSGIVAAAVMACALLAAYLLATVLQGRISVPILVLAETATAVSDRGDYSVRAPVGGEDELGILTKAFNHMLGRIEDQERALRASKEHLDLALRSAGIGIWDWKLDTGVIDWDDFMHPLFGLAPKAFSGRYEDFAALLHPDDRDRVAREASTAIAEDTLFDTEFRVVWPNGNRRILTSRGKMYRDGDAPRRITGVCWDITERKAFEAQLRKSEQTLAATLTSIHEGVAIVDADGKLVYLNPMAEQILDMTIVDNSADQWPAQYGAFSVDGETPVPPVQAPLLRALRGEQVRDIEIFIRNTALPNGAYISVNAGPLREKDGVSLGAVASFRDISHRRSLEEERARTAEIELRSRQADESNRLKSEFLANMSHELRTPLNGIIGFAELLHDGKAGPVNPDQKEYLGDVLTSGQHLLQLINDVLDLAKVESGKMEFRPEPVDLTRLVAEVRDILRTLAAQKRIDVMTEIDPTLGSVTLDPAKLKQVLYNFLSNAIKFTPDAGRVVIRAVAEADDQFRIEVEDTGIGIRPEDYPRLFVEFQQLDTTSAKKYQGTGLGLALTKRIVTAQSGRVGVQSSPGQGSTFFAVLPRVSVQETAPAVPPPFQAHSSSSSGPLILVVEDEPADRDLITRVLIEQGYRVESASTGQVALERCQAQVYAAITLDMLLPDASGRDILKAMRAGGPNRDTPVILVTAVAENGVAAGFEVADILVKPVSAAELVSALKRAGADPGSPRPILVVDDDPNALKLAEKVLREIGFRTRSVTNGVAALEAALTDSPAAIILDLRMPFMDGFEFLRRLRQTPEGRRTPVIVWTVQDLGPEERATLIAAAQAVVQKGDSVSALIEEIRNHVRMPLPSPLSADGRIIGET